MEPSVRAGDAPAGDLSASTSDGYVHVPPADEPDEMVHLNPSPSSEAHEEIPTLIQYAPSADPDGSMIVIQPVGDEPEEEEGTPDEQVSEKEESDTGCDCTPSEEEERREFGDSEGFIGENVKFELPPELTKNAVFLECESSAPGALCQICLVGTAHVSKESCDEVQSIIRLLKPQVVFLELCSSRVALLSANVQQVQSFREMITIWKKGEMNLFGLLYSWFFAKVASQLEVIPGAEFRVAFEEAVAYGAKVILGDRPIKVTLRRTWAMMPIWQKVKLLLHMFFQGIALRGPDELKEMLKAMGDVDMLTFVVQEMSKSYPTFMETIVHERDRYMSHSLLQVAKRHSSVVAVVGKGHLAGMKENWKLPITMSDLLSIPENVSYWSSKKLWTALAFSVAGVAVGSGYFLANRR